MARLRKLYLTLYSLCLLLPSFGQLPPDFYDEGYVDGLDFPMGIAFDRAGRGYVWEKAGRVRIVDTAGQLLTRPLIDIREEVANWKDHGLTGFALDPGFEQNGYFYLLYALDLHHYFHYGTSAYHPDSTINWQPTIGRVARYRADFSTGMPTAVEESRQIILGRDLGDGIPLLYEFHGLGTLLAAEDGTLLISCGDATPNEGGNTGDTSNVFVQRALELGIITSDQDLGSYRAQYLGSPNGKILRIEAGSGAGPASNPFYQVERPRSPQSRIWSYGLRNPYRIALKPESGSHFAEDGRPGWIAAGDVGNGAWEELNLITEGGQNFGWPITEGLELNWAFWISEVPENTAAPNPLYGQAGCDRAFFTFRDLMNRPLPGRKVLPVNPCNPTREIEKAAHPSIETLPLLAWSNARWNPPKRAVVPYFDKNEDVKQRPLPEAEVEGENFAGFSSLAGVFYQGDAYPDEYRHKYFGLDFSGWIRVFDLHDDGELHAVQPFHDDAGDIIHLAENPADGFLYYVNLKGEVRRISYGGNPPPVADIQTDRHFGPGPLTVQFDGSGSRDIDGDITSYAWDFGDGTGSNELKPVHTFTASGDQVESFLVNLTVTDGLGATGTDQLVVSLNNTPPTAHISSFKDGDRYPLQETFLLRLAAEVKDDEFPKEDLTYEWRVFLHHNDHYHPEPVNFEAETFVPVSPLGCGDELYWYRIKLTVTDPAGLSAADEAVIYPHCDGPLLQWTDLTAREKKDRITLQWETQREPAPLIFEIQRTADFKQFEQLGTLISDGRTDPYIFED
ncbi:MAG: PQQ-dependent sugar dehydrogenase, partial [Saprospiraceae bacterium]|nr:PQQ-dependent sugar dehydrogenase [Saprospiraceae bacterium]